ncbi:hypothetical protein SCUCBS95973_006797 [Sporothrix curviconia]|uniref:Phosphoglycerate mutase family protein n=1 Tax=Sporothrix curviconia TaxID=1260050 RepID=A0ABP0C863_9PEZI
MPVQKGSSEAIVMTHIFSSDLQRASVTASAIWDAQRKRDEGRHDDDTGPSEVIKSADLRERDFRSGEGTRFGASSGPDGSSRAGGRNAFADAESWDEMSVRAKRFIDERLDRLLAEAGDGDGDKEDRRAVVIVAHGLILNVLLSMLLMRYTPSEMARLQPPLLPGAGPSDRSKRNQLCVPWSNTGHLVIHASRPKTTSSSNAKEPRLDAEAETETRSVTLQVVSINCMDHLNGLKKTRGGIGSAQFDPKQKTMDAFFGPSAKRQKRGRDA